MTDDYPDVRRARPDDGEEVGTLWMALLEEQASMDERLEISEDALLRWKNDFPLWLEDETRRVYVAEQDGEVAGFVSAHRYGPPPIYAESSEVYLDELYVAPSHRRTGLGSQLVAALRAWTDRLGAQRIRLTVLDANEDGRAFWEAQQSRPMTRTYTIERPENESQTEHRKQTGKIGF